MVLQIEMNCPGFVRETGYLLINLAGLWEMSKMWAASRFIPRVGRGSAGFGLEHSFSSAQHARLVSRAREPVFCWLIQQFTHNHTALVP